MKQLIFIFFMFVSYLAEGNDLRGRAGIGASNQLGNELPALSLKIQTTKTFAMGAILGFRSNQDETLYGAGVKFYRIIFDEPQLNFYMAGLIASENFIKDNSSMKNGFQIDGTLGTEFHFAGLESIGLSFEMGLSAREVSSGGTSFQTLGDQFLKAAFHFYL